MSNENWTKGPWEAKENPVGSMEVGPEDSPNNWRADEYLCVTITTQEYRSHGAPIEKANAHLIAAAPELYDFIETYMSGHPEAEAVMAKARGEQQ